MAEATIAALQTAAFALFGDRGYESASLDDIVAAAGVTKGALYHHFPKGKPELFEAVVIAQQVRLVTAMTAASETGARSSEGLRAILHAYFDVALEPRVCRITLQDAPSVLGLEQWRKIEHRHTLAFIRSGIETLLGDAPRQLAYREMLSAAIFGAACEATLAVAESAKPKKARDQAVDVIASLFETATGGISINT